MQVGLQMGEMRCLLWRQGRQVVVVERGCGENFRPYHMAKL